MLIGLFYEPRPAYGQSVFLHPRWFENAAFPQSATSSMWMIERITAPLTSDSARRMQSHCPKFRAIPLPLVGLSLGEKL